MTKIACLGECMIELREMADGHFSRGYGGDTLNTAVYLARLGIAVDYVTALGDDPWSDEMIAGWAAEGIGTGQVARLPGRVPGLYIIQTDARGERRFLYWRDRRLPASSLMLPKLPTSSTRFPAMTCSTSQGSRCRCTATRGAPASLRCSTGPGSRDAASPSTPTSGRVAGPIVPSHRRHIAPLVRADIILASTEDVELLFGPEGVQELLSHRSSAELVLKLATPTCRVISADRDEEVRAEPVAAVVDTTAAGDSFAAAYIAARLSGAGPRDAAYAGHRLAGAVVQHPGAIIPSCGCADRYHRSDPAPTHGDARMTPANDAATPRTDRLSELLGLAPVIPVITIERVEDAVPLARALVSGGLRLLEITLRTQTRGAIGRCDYRRGA